jgi:hypothetical protein
MLACVSRATCEEYRITINGYSLGPGGQLGWIVLLDLSLRHGMDEWELVKVVYSKHGCFPHSPRALRSLHIINALLIQIPL